MSQKIINARVTFHNSPIHILEQFTMRDMDDAYRQLSARDGLEECVIIQTCNRVELFARSDSADGTRSIRSAWASLTGLDEQAFDDNLEVSEGYDALHHLLKLTSGLDSMVLGEEQILGQIKDSIATARQAHSSGRHLNTLFDKAVRIGTRIRNSTGIGRGGISIGSMAVKIAEENIDDMKSKRILLIGTGEVSTLVAKSLLRRGYSFDVTSRTMGRAMAFCESMGGSPVRFESVLSEFSDYDVMFVATTAPYSLVTYDRISQAMSGGREVGDDHNNNGNSDGSDNGPDNSQRSHSDTAYAGVPGAGTHAGDNFDNPAAAVTTAGDSSKKHRGMMILDLSNPRTVDEQVATIGGVKLMNLDQISEMVEKNMANRAGKVREVEAVVEEEAYMLEASMRRLAAEPIAEDVFKNIEILREKQFQKAIRALGETDSKRIQIINDLTREVVESVMSTPMNNLRKASERGDTGVIALARHLFDYEDESDDNCDDCTHPETR